jgi:hypothetical protein
MSPMPRAWGLEGSCYVETLRLGCGALCLRRPAFKSRRRRAHAAPAAVVVAQSLPPLFSTESAAQAHCPKALVAWLNIPSGIYHYKVERWYGRTKHGAYASEKEAIAADDRASKDGK